MGGEVGGAHPFGYTKRLDLAAGPPLLHTCHEDLFTLVVSG
jgi:hypothetical protein